MLLAEALMKLLELWDAHVLPNKFDDLAWNEIPAI
jgi:hypothetical protein